MKRKTSYAFIDGAFNPKTNMYGCGGFLVDQRGRKHIFQSCGSDPQMAKMRNVAGEILGAKMAISKAISLGMKKLTLYYDYEGIANWPLGLWQCRKPGTKDYANFVKEAVETGLEMFFHHVKGHSGNPENEEADQLAKLAVGLMERRRR